MLVSLSITNVVLIEQLTIEFREGLCALTGETGAGKSILLDSLGLALGYRSDSGLVRKGADQAAVSAEFFVTATHKIHELLEEQGIASEGNSVILRRTVSSDGRSRAFINDQPVSVTLLKSAGELLVEIHGQFETQSLLNPSSHRAILDEYAAAGGNVAKAWNDWKTAREELEKAKSDSERAAREESYIRESLEDLDELSPREGEEEHLTTSRDRLMRREQIIESLNFAMSSFGDADNKMNSGIRSLTKLGDDAENLVSMAESVSIELRDLISEIEAYFADLDEGEHDLQSIDERLFSLKSQARKHSCQIDELPQRRSELARQLGLIEKNVEIIGSLIKKVEVSRKIYIDEAEKLHEIRKNAAEKLDNLVSTELPPLKLDRARFYTSVEKMEETDWGAEGMDRVRFLVSTNTGTEPGPLNKIASGGEMSRFMLALKVIMAEVGSAETLIFDEVDSGIGGSTADAVGERLGRLSKTKQILVVTHSPQVAARASNHWIVSKDGKETIKTTVIHLENSESRREEIARMLSGSTITDEARAAAEKLINAA